MSFLNPSDTSIATSVPTEPIPALAVETTVGKETDNGEIEEDLIDYNEVDEVLTAVVRLKGSYCEMLSQKMVSLCEMYS
jgi:hypothetical protein